MPENKRIPLRDGTKLTDNIEIIRLISDHGGSSLVYLARQNAYHVIVKEYYPFDGFSLRREKNRCCLSCTSDEPDFQNAVNDFRNQQNQHIRAITPEGDKENYHSLYYFECNDITEEVKNKSRFRIPYQPILYFQQQMVLLLKIIQSILVKRLIKENLFLLNRYCIL